MSKLEQYTKLKKIYDEATETANQTQGAITELKKQLKEEFDCNSVEDAKQVSTQLKKNMKTNKKIIDKAIEQLEKDYEDNDIDEFE